MRKSLLIFLLGFIPLLAQDSILINKPLKITTDSRRYTYTYNEKGHVLSETIETFHYPRWDMAERKRYEYDSLTSAKTACFYEIFNNGGWLNNYRSFYFYDSVGHIVQIRSHWLNDNTWYNSDMTTYTYDNLNRVISYSYTSSFTYRYLYTYLPNGDTLSILYQQGYENQWHDSYLRTFEYNNSGKIISQVFQMKLGDLWKNTGRTDYQYDQSGRIILKFNYSFTSNNWQLNEKIQYSYDKGPNWISCIYMDAEPIDLVNESRIDCEYDEAGHLLVKQYQGWAYNLGWMNYYKLSYGYNINGDIAHGESYKAQPFPGAKPWVLCTTGFIFINDGNGTIVEGKKFDIEYADHNEKELLPSLQLYQNFPNPFNLSTTIRYIIFNDGYVKLSLFDITGSKVADIVDEYKASGIYNLQYNANDLASGVYLLQLKSGSNFNIKKVILLK